MRLTILFLSLILIARAPAAAEEGTDYDYHGPIVTRELSSAKKKMYLADIEKYKQKAIRALQEAEGMSYLIPDIEAQCVIDNMVRNAVATILIQGNVRRAAFLVVGALQEIAVGYYRNTSEIVSKLKVAEYCFEVMDSLEREMIRLEHCGRLVE